LNAGGSSTTIDDFNANWDFDRGRQGSSAASSSPVRSIRPADRLPAGSERHALLGNGLESRHGQWYDTAMQINMSGS